VSSRAPITILDEDIDAHPALRAWERMDGSGPRPVSVEVWSERPSNNPASVYRLVFPNGANPPVFAKHSSAGFGAVERLCYETILPGARAAVPTYLGSLRDGDGSWWLFLEDAGRERFSPGNPEHRLLAGHWIGQLHRRGAHVPAASTLPAAGPRRYLDHLRAARARILCNFANPGLTESDRDVLRATLALHDEVESRWDRIERACEGPPATLVHGDFQPKNIRILPRPAAAAVCVLDWETAGWGNPAVDLAPARGVDVTIQVDPDSYADEVCGRWPAVDAEAIRRLSVLGFILRRLAAVDWASTSLHFESPRYLSNPVATLRSLHVSISRGLRAAAEWTR
jgi:hypothetical protein